MSDIAMNDGPDGGVELSESLFEEYSTESCFSSQDQSWIWGSNHWI